MFEQIYNLKWIEKKPQFAFLLGIVYSLIGIVSALIVFGSSPGLMAVAFTSLLILPTLNRLFSFEEAYERTKRFSLREIYNANKEIFKIYFFLFLGILITFTFFTIILPQSFTQYIFQNQLAPIKGSFGMAVGTGNMWHYVKNNFIIMFICFIFSFVYGSGAVLMITWNASTWGVIFGFYARNGVSNPFVYFIIIFMSVFIHTIIEASAYFSAAVGGGVISKATLKEKFFSYDFNRIVKDGIILFIIGAFLVVLGAFVEAYITPGLLNFFFSLAVNLGIM